MNSLKQKVSSFFLGVDYYINSIIGSKVIKEFSRLYYEFIANYFVFYYYIQIILIYIFGYIQDFMFFINTLLSIFLISIIILIIRYFYLSILKYFDGDKNLHNYEIKKLKIFFKKHKWLNNILIYIFTYCNLYRVILLYRNIITKILRYIRYFFVNYTNAFFIWQVFEKSLTMIFNFIFDYIVIIITEIYLPFKRKIIREDIEYFLLGRMQLFFLILITQGVIVFIKVLLLLKLFELIKKNLMEWSLNKENDSIEKLDASLDFDDLNLVLYKNSHILQNLNFNKKMTYVGYNKIINVVEAEYLLRDKLYYMNSELRYYDIYGGLKLNELSEINIILKELIINCICMDYGLELDEFKIYDESRKKANDILKKQCLIIKNILKYISDYYVGLNVEISIIFYDYEPRLIIEINLINYLEEYQLKTSKKDISFQKDIHNLYQLNYEYLVHYMDFYLGEIAWEARTYYWEKYDTNPQDYFQELKELIKNKYLVEILDKKYLKNI